MESKAAPAGQSSYPDSACVDETLRADLARLTVAVALAQRLDELTERLRALEERPQS